MSGPEVPLNFVATGPNEAVIPGPGIRKRKTMMGEQIPERFLYIVVLMNLSKKVDWNKYCRLPQTSRLGEMSP